MEEKVFLKGLTYLTGSRLLVEPQESESVLWYSFLKKYPEDVYHEAIMDIAKHTTQIFPGNNIIAMLTENMDAITEKRYKEAEYNKKAEEQEARKLIAEKDARQRVVEAEEAEKRKLTPEYQAEMKKLDDDFSKYIKALTAETGAHCDKFIDKENAPFDENDLKKPWDKERIEKTRARLIAETRIGKSMGGNRMGSPQ